MNRLERVEIPLPGILEIRADHGIGSYDALLIPNATLRYERESLKLTRFARQIFLSLLVETLTEASRAASIPIVDEPGPCVMEINLEVLGLHLAVGDSAERLAELTLVMEFLDSTSREPLLRYATENHVPNPKEDTTHNEQLKQGLTQIIADMNLAGPFRSAGLGDDTIAAGCNGTLAAIGRAAQTRR